MAALTRGAIAALMRDTVTWAQSQPAWANGHARNADGAGAAMERLHTVTPTRFHTSGRPMDFIGSLVAPGEEGGKGHMETSLQLEPTAAARAARLPRGLRPPDPAAPGTDKCVAWQEEGQMWWPDAGAAAGEGQQDRDGAGWQAAQLEDTGEGGPGDASPTRLDSVWNAAAWGHSSGAWRRRRAGVGRANDSSRRSREQAGNRAHRPPARHRRHRMKTVRPQRTQEAHGSEGQQGRLQQHEQDRINSGSNRRSWARQAAHAALAEEEGEQELTDAQQADEETELAEAMEEETRLEVERDEQWRAAQEIQLEMEEMEAAEMTQEVSGHAAASTGTRGDGTSGGTG